MAVTDMAGHSIYFFLTPADLTCEKRVGKTHSTIKNAQQRKKKKSAAVYLPLLKKYKRRYFLEKQVSDLEQYTWKNNVIITGLRVKPRSYAQVVTAEVDGTADQLMSL